jgi:hypothetical protein
MKVKELFSGDIEHAIKEVIKIDDRQSVVSEIEEYVPTDHIVDELIETLEIYQETINNPSDEINIWISGFFGSGKSSFAKVLGYLLTNPEIDGKTITERFFELNEIPRAKALLNTIHSLAPTEAVLLDLNTSAHVLQDGEPIVLPIYRTLLSEFDYSSDVVLAELEFELEGEGTLEEFAAKYEELFDTPWEMQRHIIRAKNRASRVLHELDGKTFPAADSWSNAADPPVITAKWFANRAMDLLHRRRPGKKRLVLVVDEVGLYVSRSTDRMRHLQGLAEECQKTRGAIWLLATSQEKLTDVVDSLEGKQTELAKAQDRFPIRVDLLPSDIEEVTGKRVLDKTAAGATQLRELLEVDRNKFTTSVTLQSHRHQPFTDDEFVRLYPLVPYQLQVLIDAVSARRAQGSTSHTMGGSNRTLIQHAQQLVSSPFVGLANYSVGVLVTLDRSYVLLVDIIPTSWRHEVDQVAAKHGSDSLEARIMRVIALCADVPGLPLTTRNISVVLHPSISADPIESDVQIALDQLVTEDRVRETDDGFRLQSPEQKDWEKTRRGIDMKPGDAVRLRKRIMGEALGSMTVSSGRTFKIELFVEGEKMSDGDITLDLREDADIDGLRQTSRSEESKDRIFWAYTTTDDTWEALAELHRAGEMIERYDNARQTDAQRALIIEERKHQDRAFRDAAQLLAHNATSGTTVFAGTIDDLPSGELRPTANRLVSGLLAKIYPNLDVFACTVKKSEVIQVLQADNLDGLPDSFGTEGLGLFKVTGAGRELVTESGPVETVASHIKARQQFGEDQNGGQIERHFGSPPFGAQVEAVQAVLAAAMRAGLIEVVSQAARITSATDHRLEQVFGNIPKFRAASFRMAIDSGPSLDVRAEVSEWLATVTGEQLSLDLQELAVAGRTTFGELRQPCTEARFTLTGAGLAVPELLTSMDELLARVMSDDDELVVTTLHERRKDLDAGRSSVISIAELIDGEMDSLRAAKRAVVVAGSLGSGSGLEWAEELQELLDRARYNEDLAQMKSISNSIEEAATEERNTLCASVATQVEEAVQVLRSRYPKIDDSVFAATTEHLNSLSVSDDIELLRANVGAVNGAVQKVAEVFDALSTTKEVCHIRMTEVWSGPITNAEDLDLALGRLREAVLKQLNDDTEVRFQ